MVVPKEKKGEGERDGIVVVVVVMFVYPSLPLTWVRARILHVVYVYWVSNKISGMYGSFF